MRKQFNLSALADRLESEGKHAPLVGLIRKARDLQSAHTDLKIASDALAALTNDLLTSTGPNDHQRQIMQMSLLHLAIVQYARATKTTSNKRRTYDISSKLNAQEKTIHEEIVDLRDDAVAHYGTGKNFGGEWQSELLILDVDDVGGRVACLGRRLLADRLLAARMAGQVNRAKDILAERFSEVQGEVLKALKSTELLKEVGQHPFNPTPFMGSERNAQDMLLQAADGVTLQGFIDPNRP